MKLFLKLSGTWIFLGNFFFTKTVNRERRFRWPILFFSCTLIHHRARHHLLIGFYIYFVNLHCKHCIIFSLLNLPLILHLVCLLGHIFTLLRWISNIFLNVLINAKLVGQIKAKYNDKRIFLCMKTHLKFSPSFLGYDIAYSNNHE